MDLILIKITVSVLVVIGLSLVAEYASPRAAGILSGYPLGTAIVLFFFGLENGEAFAAASAPFALVGLMASQTFVFFYYKGSLVPRYSVFAATLAAVAGYLLAAWLLQCIRFSFALSVICPVISLFFFYRLFRQIENHRINARAPLTLTTILARAFISAAIILGITAVPRLAGPAWSGLFSSFPSTLFPLLLIVHLNYGKEHAHTIIKNFPLGLGSLITYCLSVALFYPRLGLYGGTAAAFALATGYLGLYALTFGRAD